MKFSTVLTVLGAVSLSSASVLVPETTCPGAKQCQCSFNDGSHCCVYGANAMTGGEPYECSELCKGAARMLQSGEKSPTHCNAGGKFSCASIFTVQMRTPCYNNAAIPP